MELFAGLRSQIKNLKDRLKALDTSKKTQKEVKEVVDALNALEERYSKEKAKRDEKKKLKETKNEKAHEESKKAPKETVEASESTDVKKESADVVPEMGTNWPEVLKNKEYKPMDPTIKKDIVKNVEKKLGPAIIGKFDIDAMVEPVRGEAGSKGKVMRHDKPEDLVYVMWHDGPLAQREQFGGYYPSDLRKVAEEPKPEHCPCWEDKSVYCPECKTQKTSDLKSNYMDMLQDLKDEHKEALDKADYVWEARLKQKIAQLEEKIKELFGKQAEIIDHPSGTERLTVIDQTPMNDKALTNPDGKDSRDEYQDALAIPDSRDLNKE